MPSRLHVRAAGRSAGSFSRLAVKDRHFGIDADAKQGRRRLEFDGFVKAGLKPPDRLIHNHYRRTLVHADNTAKPVIDRLRGQGPIGNRQ